MSNSQFDKMSKLIALVLRHKPEAIGISLDEHGWANVDDLISGINSTGRHINMHILSEIVRTDSKQRYSFNDDKTLIRANQGHSVPVNVQLTEVEPTDYLYHGTAIRFAPNILENGIMHMNRLHVHISSDVDTAFKVGSRHGNPIVFVIDAPKMYRDGYEFYMSENKVWLTDYIPKEYIHHVIIKRNGEYKVCQKIDVQ